MLAPDPDLDYGVDPEFILNIIVRDELYRRNVGANVLTITIFWKNTPPAFIPAHYVVAIPERCGDEITVSMSVYTIKT